MTTSTLTRSTVLIPNAPGVGLTVHGDDAMTAMVRPDAGYGVRRKHRLTDFDGMSDNAKIRHIIAYDGFWAAAALLPKNRENPLAVGRRAHNPDWVLFYAVVVAAFLGTQRGASLYLEDRYTWRYLRKALNRGMGKRNLGYLPAPVNPPTLNAMRHFLRRVRMNELDFPIGALGDAVRAVAWDDAREMGFLDENTRMFYDQPDTSQWLAYDGTVFPAPSTYEPSEAKVHRVDAASGKHYKNGHDMVYGSKVLFGSMRTTQYGSRVILDFDHVFKFDNPSKVGDEAAYIVNSALRMKEQFPGLRGIIADGIMSGTHIVKLAESNIHTICKPTAASNPESATKGTNNSSRVEKSGKMEVYTHKDPSGRTCTHTIWAYGTDLFEEKLNAEGTADMVPLMPVNCESRKNRTGSTWRHYLNLVIPCRHGDLKRRLALFHNPKNGVQLPRGELLRYYPLSSPQFRALYGRRNDTESLHNQLKLKVRRMPSYGRRTQMLFVIGMVIAHNAVSAALRAERAARQKTAAPPV